MSSIPDRVLDLAIRIQQIPAPTFHEEARGCFVAGLFQNAGLAKIENDPIGNVYACRPGSDPSARPVVVSAHLDTVFPHATPLDVRREKGRVFGPGIGDNSLAVAALFGLLWKLDEHGLHLPGDLWLVGNVCEEGLGDLKGMRAVVDRFQSRPAAYIVLEGMALGHIYHRGLAVRRYRIGFETEGGHSWGHFGRPSAIHEMGRLIAAVAAVEVPKSPRTTFNVGIVEGGTSINTIAPTAALQLDLRSESSESLDALITRIEEIVQARRSEQVKVRMDVIGSRPGGELPADHPLIALAENSLRRMGIQPKCKIGSTDANLPLSLGLPAICIGITRGGGGHTVGEYLLTEPINCGLQHLLDVVCGAWG